MLAEAVSSRTVVVGVSLRLMSPVKTTGRLSSPPVDGVSERVRVIDSPPASVTSCGPAPRSAVTTAGWPPGLARLTSIDTPSPSVCVVGVTTDAAVSAEGTTWIGATALSPRLVVPV